MRTSKALDASRQHLLGLLLRHRPTRIVRSWSFWSVLRHVAPLRYPFGPRQAFPGVPDRPGRVTLPRAVREVRAWLPQVTPSQETPRSRE